MMQFRRSLQILFSTLMLFMAIPSMVSAEDDLLDPDVSVDDLFGTPAPDTAEEPAAPAPEPEPEEQEEPSLLDSLKSSGLEVSGSFSLTLGYTAGWSTVPWISVGGLGGFGQSMLVENSSALALDVRISPDFRIRSAFLFTFPHFQFQVSELFADYAMFDKLYWRVGRQQHSWGISRFYPFTNLTARLPDSWSRKTWDNNFNYLKSADSYSIKLNIPAGVGGFELLGFMRNGFLEDAKNPGSDIGIGGNFNLAIPYLDLTVGSFYQKDLNLRTYASASTTLAETELYSEFLFTYITNPDNNKSDLGSTSPANYVQPSRTFAYGANFGFLRTFFNDQLTLAGEYYWTNEEVQLEMKGRDFPLIPGHNLALALNWNFDDGRFGFQNRLLYNINEYSGIFVPSFVVKALPYLDLKLSTPIIFGNVDGTYALKNPDTLKRNAAVVLSATLKGAF